jgi:hypothetical protein
MAYTLDEFAADCRRILTADPGPAGRDSVLKRLQDLLMNEDFVAAHCGPNASGGANLLYEDPELGFQILAHIRDRDYAGGPHDHGDSWAIFGQAVKYTDMSEWKRTDDGSVPSKVTIEKAKTYRMERGQAGIFQNRAIDFTKKSLGVTKDVAPSQVFNFSFVEKAMGADKAVEHYCR